MSRSKGMDRRASRLRADLDGATLALVDCEEVMPEIELRVNQAIRRSGLSALLSPVLEDLERMTADIHQAKLLVACATVKLME